MTFDIDLFRASFPEFADPVKYPDDAIAFWASTSGMVLSSDRWGTSYRQGVSLYVAHQLALAGIGGVSAGAGGGVVASKSVGGASISYDTTSATSMGAGFYNATGYGRQLWYLIRLFGAGCVQL